MSPQVQLVVFLAMMGTAAAGCGDGRPERVPVAGRVLIDGKPLAGGSIRVYPSDHRAASSSIDAEGRFNLSTYERGDGVVHGVHPVTVNASALINPRTLLWNAPKKYYSPSTSGLTFEVSEPTESAEIHLTWDGGKPFDEQIVGGGD